MTEPLHIAILVTSIFSVPLAGGLVGWIFAPDAEPVTEIAARNLATKNSFKRNTEND